MSTKTRTEITTTVRNLKVGDEILYHDGNQVVTKIERLFDINFKPFFDIYVEGISTPRRQPGRAPITFLREA